MHRRNPKPLPEYIQKYAFDFRWDNTLLWQLDVPVVIMDANELLWHLDIPWLHTENGRFNVLPHEVMRQPEVYKVQYARTMEADLSYPIDVMFNKDRWLILDGLHRLMKSVILGKDHIRVRKIPRSMVPLISTHVN